MRFMQYAGMLLLGFGVGFGLWMAGNPSVKAADTVPCDLFRLAQLALPDASGTGHFSLEMQEQYRADYRILSSSVAANGAGALFFVEKLQ